MYLRTSLSRKDNTVGSRPKSQTCAYIAGFLDGDGSLMFQLKKRTDTLRGWRFMATICLYQDTRHEEPLHWIRSQLGIGYLSRRNDGISEIRINGFKQVRTILSWLLPYTRFKKVQARVIYRACDLLARKEMSALTKKDKIFLCHCLLTVQEHNYATRRKKTFRELCTAIGLTP